MALEVCQMKGFKTNTRNGQISGYFFGPQLRPEQGGKGWNMALKLGQSASENEL